MIALTKVANMVLSGHWISFADDALRFGRLWYGEPNASDFVIKEITAPHTNGMKGGFFPQFHNRGMRRGE